MDRIIAGRYQLQELIGQGGMADVYSAYDPILSRTVAVKIMRSSLTGDTVYVTRFKREATAAASLNHKNIVSIYDVGEDHGNYYIVMEYVKGQTLKELIKKRGALHYIEALDIMKQVVSAVTVAHQLGIIHRDLKPQNIMIKDNGMVKIGDFGIASIQSLSQVTQADTILGSLHYLAPEVARGEKASPASDIYALGIMLYELLRGEVPFNGESPVNIALKHMREEIPSIHEFNPSVPQSLENIIIKSTAKNVGNRYESAKDMQNDLENCLLEPDVPKLVFDYKKEAHSDTIVADEDKFFTRTEVTNSAKPVETKPEKEKPKPKLNKKKLYMIAGIGGVIVAALIFVIASFLFRDKTKRIPDVTGKSQQEATAILEDEGFVVSDNVLFELTDNVEEGNVVFTDPEPFSNQKKGTTVTLTVSSGKYVIMSNYIGYDYTNALTELNQLGFKVKKSETVSDQDEGTVLSQSIDAGEKFSPDSVKDETITLTVAKKPSVPNVVGNNIEEAKKRLEGIGLTVKYNDLYNPNTTMDDISGIVVNEVVKQSISEGTKITSAGTIITLDYYSALPKETPKPDPIIPEPTVPEENPVTPGLNGNTGEENN